MQKQLMWKSLLVAAITVACAFAIIPPQEKIRLGLDLKGGQSYLLQMDLEKIPEGRRRDALHQAVQIIRKRVDKFGVAEPLIQPVGDKRILVQLPGLSEKDREEAERTLSRTAFLEFRLVHERNDELLREMYADPDFQPPVGFEKMEIRQRRGEREIHEVYFVKIKPELTGVYVREAYVDFDNLGRPHVALRFTPQGAEIFARVTTANVGRQLAIVLDGELQSAPVIRTAIEGGNAVIEGNFSFAEARELANVLENPLEAPIKIIEERGVDPSLGRDSIQSGVTAAVIGTVLVALFMVAYYRFSGLVANLALILNLVILMGVLAMFGFTLTMPGIAGIVLAVGMAVDANVLIYERIREELRLDKPLRAAVAAGYARAFRTILDANVTTLITALILVWMGTGPIKGFGITLTIGLLANLFTAVFVTRIVFDYMIMKGRLKSLPMMRLIGDTSIDFLGKRVPAFSASWVLIGVGLVAFSLHGGFKVGEGKVWGIDFAGGDSLTLAFEQKVDANALRRAIEQARIGEVVLQYQKEFATGKEFLLIRSPHDAADQVQQTLTTAFPDAKFTRLQLESVGPIVGHELLKQAGMAVLLGCVGILIYVAARYEFAFGVAAIVALIHDVLMTVGWFCLTQRQFSAPFVAAILTIIGFSINDTIVVFDRIREDLKLFGHKLTWNELINRSINETLARTLLTSGTVLIATLALYLWGGGVINDFAFTFLVGILTGTYSSIFIASPILLWWHRQQIKPTVRKPQPAKA
jgi:SecD/SecF fusion protein